MHNHFVRKFLFPMAVAIGLAAPAATMAAPSGEHLVAGMAEFSRQGGNLTIDQISDRAIINWQDFSISHGNLTRFVQPGESSAVLNRVMSGNPSRIFGELQANGQVFLINPNGVLVGSTGVINTRSFAASTLELSNQDFMDGGDLSFSGQGAGIANLGTIRGLGGDVFLIAPQIDNQGVIEADGVAGLGAGAQVLLRDSGSQRLWVGAAPNATDGNGIDNSGLISATQAELQAAGGNVYALSINNSGVVRATTVANEGGRILLRAGSGGTVISSGTLDASSETGQGGHIEVTGTHVGLMGSAVVDASGRHGGGEVLIGGDFQGTNTAVMNAERTYVGAGATIRADGGVDGDGGKVIVWADDSTRYYGNISARGGSQRGDGGFVEVSGKEHLAFAGHVDAGASNGRAGSLLLDPKNIIISNAGVDILAENNAFGHNPGDDVTIAPSSITAITNAGTAVTLQANNDIAINSSIISNNTDPGVNGGNGGHMTFQAGRSISINANITSDNGNITFVSNVTSLNADPNHRDPGAAIFHNDGQIHAGTGTVNITIGAGNNAADPDARATGDILTGNVNAANMVVTHAGFTPGGVVDIGATTLSNNLTVTTNDRDIVNSSGAITVLGIADFNLGTGDFTITGLNTDFDRVRFGSVNNVTLNDVNAVQIGQGAASNIAGDLVVTTRGPIGTNGAVIVAGETHLTTVSGGFGVSPSDVTLNHAGNDFQGLVTVNAAGGVNLRDSNDLALATLDAGGSVTLTTDGHITSTGRLFMPTGVTTPLTLSSGVNGDVTLTDSGNRFQYLRVLSGRDIDLLTTDGVIFDGNSNISGNFDLTAGGTIRNRFTNTGTVTVGGDTTFTVTAANSDLLIGGSGNTNNFIGSVGMLTGGAGSYRDVTFRNVNADASVISGFPDTLRNAAFTFDNASSVELPAMTLTGSNSTNINDGLGSLALNVNVPNGNITQAGPIVLTDVNATTRLNVGWGNDIVLEDAGNDFQRMWVTQAGNVSLRDSTGMVIDRIETHGATGNGDLKIVAGGNVSLINWIRVKGMASFDVGGANNVTLNNLNTNTVGGLAFPSANNVSYQGTSSIVLGASEIFGTLFLQSNNTNRTITQSGTVTTGGTTTFRNFGGGITLGDSENVFGNIAITDIVGNPTVTIRENDAITQSGNWNLNNGTLNLATSNNQAITLTNANEFQFVNVTQHDNGGEPGAVSIRNAHAAHGIQQSATWTTAGMTTLNAGGNGVVLNNQDNVLGDLVVGNADEVSIVEDDHITQGTAWSLNGIDVSLTARNGNDIVLDQVANTFGDLTLSGHDLTVVEASAITQDGAWTSTGRTTLTAGVHDITLDNNSNAFNVVEVVSGGEVTVYDQDAMVIDGANADGRLTLSVGGHLTQTDRIIADSLRIIGTGFATLEDPNNNVNEFAAAFTGGALSYADADGFTIAILGESPGILVGAHAVTLVAHDGTIDGLTLINSQTSALDVTANTLEIPAMNIAGSQSYTAGDGITLNNNIVSSAAGAVSFNGPVTLANNISINTVNSAVDFNGTLDGVENTLTVTAGTGDRNFTGAVSNLGTSVGGVALLLNGAGTAEFHGTVSANNGIISGGPVIFRDDVTLADGNIGSNFSGLVTLGKIGGMDFSGYDGLTFDGGLLLDSGPASIVSNDSQLILGNSVSGPYALSLDAGQSSIVGLSNLQGDLTGLSVTAFSMLLPSGLSIAGPQSFTLTNGNGAIELGGLLSSTAAGDITFLSPVLLTANSTISTVDSAVIFEGAVNGARNLTLSSGEGEKHFLGQVGNQTPIGTGTGAAIVLQGDGETFFEDTLRTASGITSEGPVTFKADVTLGNGNIGSTFNGVVTAGDLSIDGHDGIAFNGGMNLVDGLLTVTSNGSTISFGDTVQGAQGLTLNSLADGTGTVTGLEHVANDLAALTISAQTLSIPQDGIAIAGPMHFTASGGITVNGDVGNVSSGTIDLVGPITLATQDITVTTGDADVTFAGSIDGARNLTVNSGAGLKTFEGAVSIGTGNGHALTLQGAGGNDFRNPVTLASGLLIEDGSDTALTHGLTMNNGDTGSHFGSGMLAIGRNDAVTSLSGHDGLTFGGGLVLIGDAVTIDSNGSNLTFIDGVLVDAAADTVFDGNIVMQNGLTIEVDSSSLEINGSVDGNHAFIIDGNGQVAVNGDIGLNQNVASVTISADSIGLGGEVRTHGTQDYSAPGGITLTHNISTMSSDINFTGPITLTDDISISTNTDGGNVHFIGANSTIDGNHELMVHANSGNVTLDGAVGDTTPLARILLDGYDIAAGRITVDGDDSLMADNHLTITTSRSFTEATYLIADRDGDGAGTLILLDGVTLTPTAGTGFLMISAADLDLQGNSSIDAGNSFIGIDSSAVNGITLGADRAGAMNISANELARMNTDAGFGLRALNGSTHDVSDIHIDTAFGDSDLMLGLYGENIRQTQPIEAAELFLEAVGGVIDLGHAGNLISAVYIESGAGSVNLRNNADILQLEGFAWDLTGIDVTLRADGHDILLTAGDNRFGTLNLTGHDATVVSAIALTLGAGALSGSLDAEADGAITIAGVLDIDGDLSLVANGLISQSAPLTVDGNVTLVTTHDAGDVGLRNDGDTILGGSLIGGNFNLDSQGGTVTQAAGSALRIAGDFDPNGSGSVLLGGVGNIIGGEYQGVDGDNIIRQLGVVDLGDEDIDGNLTVISEASALGFDDQVTAGDAVLLTDAGNRFGGSVSITTEAPEIVAGEEQQTGIRQQEGTSLNVSGQASFTAEHSSVEGSGFIDLTNPGNQFGSLLLNGVDVQARQEHGDMVIDGAQAELLGLHAAAGGISQTGAIVAGELDITAAGQVLLGHVDNDIARLDASVFGHDLTLRTISALISGDIVTDGGDLSLFAGGAITQNSSLVNIGMLTLSADGEIVLDSESNNIDTLGDISANGDIFIRDNAGGLMIDGLVTSTDGDVVILTEGDMTIAAEAGITVDGSGDVALSATGDFINLNDGETISLDTGRFLIYTTDVDGVVKGGLSGGALFNRNYADNAPGTITHEGNLFVYSFTPTLTLRPEDVVAVYGELPVLIYVVDGLLEGHTVGQAFSGNPSLTSEATAGSNVGFYDIEIAQGGIDLTDLGYDLAFDNNDAQVEITPRVIDLGGVRTFDGTTDLAAGIFLLDNLFDGQTLTLSGAGTMADRHADNGKAVSLGTLALGDGDNGGLASNYMLAGGTHTVDITPAALTITSSDVIRTYDGTTMADGTAIVSGGQLFGGDAISGGSFTFTNPNAGNGNKVVTVADVLVNDGNSGGNYAVAYADNTTSTILPYVVDLTGARSYDGSVDLAAGIFTLGALVGDETLSLSGTGTMADRHAGNGKPVTTGTLELGDGTGLAGNYTLTGGSRTVDITPADLTVSVGDISKVYDGTTSAAGSAIVINGQLFGDDQLVGGSFAFTDPNAGNGNKVVTVTGVTVTDGNEGGNYVVAQIYNTTSTISPAPLAIHVDDQRRSYGMVNPELTWSADGFVAGEGVADLSGFTVSTVATEASEVGDYAITAAANAQNYAIAFHDGLLTIDPAALVITIDDQQRRYGGVNPELTWSADGLVLGHDLGILTGFSIGTDATTVSPVGAYTITGTGTLTNPNYVLDVVDGVLTIDPAVLTVNVANASRAFGVRDSSFFATVSGFVNDESISVVDGELRVVDTTDLLAAAGVYADALVPEGIEAANYVIDFVPGLLTISGEAVESPVSGQELNLRVIQSNERDRTVMPLYVYNSIVPVARADGVYRLQPRSGSMVHETEDGDAIRLLAYGSSFGRP